MIEDSKLKEIQTLINKEVKNISYEGQVTIIEFEDGQILPLYGGVAGVEGIKNPVRYCSFCGNEAHEKNPVASLNKDDDPLICRDCTVKIIQTFIENNIELEIDLSNIVSEDTIKRILDKNKDLS